MPVTEGIIEGKTVNVLRDTSCSTVTLRCSLVPDKLTGQEERCILIDGMIHQTPLAEKIYVKTPFYTESTTAVCMKNPIYDLMIGNIQGAINITDPQQALQATQAIQTRSQAKTSRGFMSLVTAIFDFGLEDLAKLQKDKSLQTATETAKQKDNPQI